MWCAGRSRAGPGFMARSPRSRTGSCTSGRCAPRPGGGMRPRARSSATGGKPAAAAARTTRRWRHGSRSPCRGSTHDRPASFTRHVAGLGSCHGGGVSVPPAAAIEPSTAAEGLPGLKSSRPPSGRRVVRRCEPLAEAAATVPSSETGGSAPASTGDTSALEHEQRGVRELLLAVLSASDKQLLLKGGMSRASPTPAGTTRRRTPRREVLDDASRRDRATRSLRFAYADPPYPGKAGYDPEQAEVDHQALVERLVASFEDGWALATSAEALPHVLTLCPAGVRG